MSAPMTTDPRRPGLLSRLFRFRRDERGVAFVEFAFIAPIMVALLFGTVELSEAIMADRRVTKVASSVADLIARAPRTGVSCDDVKNIFEIGAVLMEPYDSNELNITVYVMQTTNAAGTSYNWKWKKWNGKGQGELAMPTVPTGLSRSRDEQVVVVQVEYKYDSPITKVIMKNQLTLSETFYLKPRQGFANITGRPPSDFNYACPNG